MVNMIVDSNGTALLEDILSRPMPPEITAFRDRFEGEIRAADVAFIVTGQFDVEKMMHILQMQLFLEALFAQWVAQELHAMRGLGQTVNMKEAEVAQS